MNNELSEHLSQLDEMCITLDGGNIKLNFVEAALLIQGSACIYSKKVSERLTADQWLSGLCY